MTSEEVEVLRESHKPARVGVLLVGESAPASGGFVYDAAPSMLQRAIKAAMAEIIGAEASFHDGLKARRIYIDDLVLAPVDKLSPADRRRRYEDSVPALAKRLRDQRPRVIVSLLKRIRPYVEKARIEAGLDDVPHHAVCFPGFGNYGRFQQEMAELMPLLQQATFETGELPI